jgi:hypothetical protein
MNEQNEMKQIIRDDGNDSENGRISKMRWNKWLDKVKKTVEMEE